MAKALLHFLLRLALVSGAMATALPPHSGVVVALSPPVLFLRQRVGLRWLGAVAVAVLLLLMPTVVLL